jgi:HAD superfamily phosphatase (TIGR01668 family)
MGVVDSSGDSGENVRSRTLFLHPDLAVGRLEDVPLDVLGSWGIRGIIVDLDNTLVGYAQSAVAPEVCAWMSAAQNAGFRLVLLSNNFAERVASIGASLGVPTVPNALKPLPLGYLRAMRLLGTRRAQTAVIGDQLFTDVLGAKLLGLRSILTEPLIATHEFPATRFLRLLERVVRR